MILTEGPIPAQLISEMILKACTDLSAGGHSIFIGQVRNDKAGSKTVKAISYSAYETMVSSEAEKIIALTRSQYNDTKEIEIVHSTGIVAAGEISLFVIVSAGHRHHAIQACTTAVELIKERLPIWKKEIFEDNSVEWKENSF